MEPVHLASPLSFNAKGVAATAVQNSSAEIDNCVLNIAVCPIGFRDDLPEFGITDPTFETIPLDLATLAEQLHRWEPRATLTLQETEEAMNSARRQIAVEVA